MKKKTGKTTRQEHDSMGTFTVPARALYGAQTARAVENFPISGLRAHPELIRAFAALKWAGAETNRALGYMDAGRAHAIAQASREVYLGRWNKEIVVDAFQAGAGTSFNMNLNEVIANRANQILGGRIGEYKYIHPNDDVNMGQSTNDTFPTAMRLAGIALWHRFDGAMDALERELRKKADAFDGIVKSGRTHLQDAVPVRLGQEFGGYAEAVAKARPRVRRAADSLRSLGIGGSAAGTGLNTHPRFQSLMVRQLVRITGEPLFPAKDKFEAMQSMAPFCEVSAALRNFSLDLTRIANDLRLLSSGPRTGIGEIVLPPVQPGSSIMPGKVNPVMAEVTDMVCFQVAGNDLAIALGSQAGQLELNVMMPVITFNLNFSFEILTNVIEAFTKRC
ncbi:MAG: aspartate ammonia-lyase, partial [Vicinamibacteria bacterium]